MPRESADHQKQCATVDLEMTVMGHSRNAPSINGTVFLRSLLLLEQFASLVDFKGDLTAKINAIAICEMLIAKIEENKSARVQP